MFASCIRVEPFQYFFEVEHVLDVFKIERDIKDFRPLSSEYIRRCRAYMVLSPSLHALLYQLLNLCIKRGQSVSAQPGSKSFPYTNFIGASSKSWISSTPIDFVGPNRRPEGGLNGSLKSDLEKPEGKKFLKHPNHLKQWVSVPHSSGRLSALGILTHWSRNTHAEAKRWKAYTDAHTHKRTKEDRNNTIEKKSSQEL